jgi:hypothetical protein
LASLRRFLLRLLNACRPTTAEPDLERELQSHLQLLEDEYRRRGLSADDAKHAAKRSLGSVELAKDLHRETSDDHGTAQPVAIVTESFVRQFWPGQDPIGKRLKWGSEEYRRPWITVVGVVADVKQDSLDRPAPTIRGS